MKNLIQFYDKTHDYDLKIVWNITNYKIVSSY